MNRRFSNASEKSDRLNNWRYCWSAGLAVWLLILVFLPDPRPLSAPDWSVSIAEKFLKLSEPMARLAATMVLRTIGIGMIGVLLSGAVRGFKFSVTTPVLLLGAPGLALIAKTINFGTFPASPQLEFILVIAFFSGLLGLVFHRSVIALVLFCVLPVFLFVWGAATGISDELDEATRTIGQYVLDHSGSIPDGNDGFVELIERTFSFAKENSNGHDPVLPNKAAILALGVILGEDKVAWVGGRELNENRKRSRVALRKRIRVRNRNDLSRHFWVSASLTVLSDADRALTVGRTKELTDSTPGGSGFSFVDMAANMAGIRLAVQATRDAKSAGEIQRKLSVGVKVDDIFPSIEGLPEGIRDKDFQSVYGGLGGSETKRLFSLIQKRVEALSALN